MVLKQGFFLDDCNHSRTIQLKMKGKIRPLTILHIFFKEKKMSDRNITRNFGKPLSLYIFFVTEENTKQKIEK